MSTILTDLSKLHREVLWPQVRIKAEKAGGSGTIIYSTDKSTFALSCDHVISEAVKVRKEWDSKLTREAKKEYRQVVTVEFFDYENSPHGHRPITYTVDGDIVAYDKPHDMALIKLRVKKPYPYVAKLLPLNEVERIQIGTPVHAVGAALLHDPILTTGIVTHMGDEIDYKDYWMSNANIIFGNCITGDSRVLTNPRGGVPISQLHEGDSVLSFLPNIGVVKRKVLRLLNSGTKPVYRLITRSRTVEASADHPFLVAEGEKDRKTINQFGGKFHWKLEWRKLSDVKKGDLILSLYNGHLNGNAYKLPIVTKGHNQFTNEDVDYGYTTDDFMRLVGCFLGDGWVRIREGVGGSLTLALYDEELILKYTKIISESLKTNVHRNGGCISAESITIAKLFHEIGLNKPSHEKVLPAWVFSLPSSQLEALLEGYIDSDGHVTRRGCRSIECVSEELTRQIREIAMLLGYRVTNVYTRLRNGTIGQKIGDKTIRSVRPTFSFTYAAKRRYQNHLGKPNIQSLTSLLPNDVELEMVKSITYAGEKPTYDIQVEGAHNFFADGILVHNSGGAIFTVDTHEFLGIPSRIDIAGWGSPITHLGYFSPITRVYGFLNEQNYQFIHDRNFTEEQCAKAREEAKKNAKPNIDIDGDDKEEGPSSPYRDSKASD